MTPTLFDQQTTDSVVLPEASRRIEAARPVEQGPFVRELAARSDPRTSHVAALEVAKSGVAKRQARQVAEAVERFPGHTTADLAKLSGLDRFVVAKRVSVAERLGLIRRGAEVVSKATGRQGESWWPSAGAAA